MKVRVTFDITDTDRIAISVLQGDGFKNATRESIEAHIVTVVGLDLAKLREKFELFTTQLAVTSISAADTYEYLTEVAVGATREDG